MNVSFDYFGQIELPYIILTNPDKTELFSLGLAYSTKITEKFNALSEFSFVFPKSIDGGVVELEAYDYIQNKRLILIENYGYYQITNASEDLTGAVPIKNVYCQKLESELIQKRVTAYGGTRPLWDILDSDGTVLQSMIDLAPNWSVGHVDVELLTTQRTFNVSDTNVYNFLMNDVSKAFECVFIFNSVTREINVYALANATTVTDIFLSFDNVISNATFYEKSDEIVTAMSVYGGGVLNIRNVNPLGTDKIYNFSYYKTTEWMSAGLVTALTNWESLVDTQQPIYANNLALLQTYNAELLTLQSDLATLNSEYLSLEGIQAIRIQAGEDYSEINIALEELQDDIDAQNVLIQNKQGQINTTTSNLQAINLLVSFDTNFTPSQLLELNNFMYENTYKNENIIQTDFMTPVEIQTQAQNLYNQAVTVLGRVSQPRYEFGLEAVNYTTLSQFQIFTEQTELGSEVTVEIKDGSFINSVVLEIVQQFDDPSVYSMTLSNRLRLDNGNFAYTDLMGQVVKTGSSVAFDSVKWSNWENDYKDEVTTFVTSALNTAVNNLISNNNQDITINQNGLRARQWNGTSYDGKQVWLVNNMLAFSDDGFQTAKLALGEIALPSGGTGYGLVAPVLVGQILAGNTLTITNSGNNFLLDASGAYLTNATLNVQTTNTKIIIDPIGTNSLVIQKNEGGTFVNKFWVDNTGSVNFSGTLQGANGSFSGTLSAVVGNIGTLVIDANGLKTADNVNYLRGNGDLKWGGLSITGSTASFSGDIFANKIVGQIVNTQITNGAVSDNKISSGVDAGKMTFGSMSGNRIFGGTASPASINLSTGILDIYTSGAFAVIDAAGSSRLRLLGSGSAYIDVLSSAVSVIGNLGTNGQLDLSSSTSVLTPSGNGINGIITVSTPSGNRTLRFSRGVCYALS